MIKKEQTVTCLHVISLHWVSVKLVSWWLVATLTVMHLLRMCKLLMLRLKFTVIVMVVLTRCALLWLLKLRMIVTMVMVLNWCNWSAGLTVILMVSILSVVMVLERSNLHRRNLPAGIKTFLYMRWSWMLVTRTTSRMLSIVNLVLLTIDLTIGTILLTLRIGRHIYYLMLANYLTIVDVLLAWKLLLTYILRIGRHITYLMLANDLTIVDVLPA